MRLRRGVGGVGQRGAQEGKAGGALGFPLEPPFKNKQCWETHPVSPLSFILLNWGPWFLCEFPLSPSPFNVCFCVFDPCLQRSCVPSRGGYWCPFSLSCLWNAWLFFVPHLCSGAGYFLCWLPRAGLADTRAGVCVGTRRVGRGCSGDWRLRAVRCLMTILPLPSQLLRDLDSCNSDPVAVASCFVERVRRAGSLPPSCLAGGLSPGEGLSARPQIGRAFGVEPGTAGWTACPRQMGTEMALQMLGESALGARGMCLIHPGL